MKLLHAHNKGQAQSLKALHDDGLPLMDALEHGVQHLWSKIKYVGPAERGTGCGICVDVGGITGV